jgi:nucleoside 2-deoxyribosyltransferase
MHKHRLYLAGPFFNSAQIDLIRDVEDALTLHGVNHFSPRKIGLNSNPATSKPTPEQAEQIFKKDYQEICASTHVLAVVDWALPPGQSVRLCRDDIPGNTHLQVPDSGTVWEMGCAYALRVPVILYTANPSKQMNLMLTQSATGVIYGHTMLMQWLACDMDATILEGWKGDHR